MSQWQWWVLVILIVVGFVVVYNVVQECCDDDEVTPAAVELIIKDSHSAAWMHLDNAYTQRTSEPWSKWDGVLIQLGQWWEYKADGTWKPLFNSEWVKIEGTQGSPVTLYKTDFDWLNIVGNFPANDNAPITHFEDGYRLFPNSVVQTSCSVVDGCIKKDVVAPPTKCDDPIDRVPAPCARMRSLHGSFTPWAAITYWQGANGHDLSVAQNATKHNRFHFGFKDQIAKITLWKNGSPAPKQSAIDLLGTITKITIADPAIQDHGESHAPPVGFSQVLGGGSG